ncbi:MAG: hypothetical protein ACFCD0_18690 [Gemmataceae bacterium]
MGNSTRSFGSSDITEGLTPVSRQNPTASISSRIRRWTTTTTLVALAVTWVVWNHAAFRATCLPVIQLPNESQADIESLVYRRIIIKPTKAKRLFPRGYTLGKPPYSHFGIIKIGNRWLVVCRTEEDVQSYYDGIVEPLAPFDRDVLVPRLRERFPDHRYFNVRLNTVAPWGHFLVFGVIIPALTLLGMATKCFLSKTKRKADR